VFAIHVAGPSLGERTRECEQHRPARERPPHGVGTQAAPARVDYERTRREQCFNFGEAQRLLEACAEAAGRRTIERGTRLGDLGQQRRHARAFRRLVRARECRLRGRRAQHAQRDLGRGQIGHCLQRWRQAVRVEAFQSGCSFLEAAEQERASHRDQTRMQGIGAIGARLERGRRRRQSARRAAQVTHGKSHLGLRHDTAGARQLLVRTEAARSAR
jgi:hypothetical protein